MIVVLDNYDSFTYNLVHLAGRLTNDIVVHRNDTISVEEVKQLKPNGIIISPGPGRPENAGITMNVIRELGSSIPILGVCLGHQAIGAAFGGKIVYASTLVHGKTSQVYHNNTGIFAGVKNPIEAGRYHSLVVARESLPSSLEVTAQTDDGLVMALQHTLFPICGVQFHPESILTPSGEKILENWLKGIL
ncbi:MAG TPA: aminodeoxychorismate/anthranilate synthase component II [Bacteroidota bacterium]|nr:aminodeoxychorismate/anthranilate synthase component II [Bacteroidota bacterium]